MNDRKDSTMYHQEYISKRFPNPSFMTEKMARYNQISYAYKSYTYYLVKKPVAER